MLGFGVCWWVRLRLRWRHGLPFALWPFYPLFWPRSGPKIFKNFNPSARWRPGWKWLDWQKRPGVAWCLVEQQ